MGRFCQASARTQLKPRRLRKLLRQSSGDFIAELSEQLPELIGGSADLSGSNSTIWAAAAPVTRAGNGGNYIYYGVREFAMTAIASGSPCTVDSYRSPGPS